MYEHCGIYLEVAGRYLQVFNDLGMIVYLSGHLHVYERSKSICKEGVIATNLQTNEVVPTYSKGCAVFVVEGVSGNSYFVAMSKTCNNALMQMSLKASVQR